MQIDQDTRTAARKSGRPVRRLVAAAIAFAAIVAGAGPVWAGPDDLAPGPVDVGRMAKAIDNTLSRATPTGTATAGYAYAIARDGKLAATSAPRGWARQPYEGNIPMDPTRRLDVFSVTKNFTAAATLTLLEKAGPSVDSPISAFLPPSWPRHPSWAQVTFRQLLSHTSGLNQMAAGLTPQQALNYTTLWNGLRFAVTQPVVAGSGFSYSNVNYAFLRIIIPVLWRQVDPGAGVPPLSPTNSGSTTLRYINEKLLAPAGIAPTSCQAANPATATLAYQASNTANPGVLFQLTGPNAEACAGHRGLFLSAIDLVRWQAHLAHGNVVSAAVRAQMDNGKLGWQPWSDTGTRAGMFGHDGDGFNAGSTHQVHTCVLKFPGAVEASLVINSSNLSGQTECTVLINAYRAAIS